MPPQSIYGTTDAQLISYLQQHKLPTFRAKQILNWVWVNRVHHFASMANVPKTIQYQLQKDFSLSLPEVMQVQGPPHGTQKMLTLMEDGELVESVIIPAARGEDGTQSARITVCVSSQVGCAFGCKFCASGLGGLVRNLTTAEIVTQLLNAEQITGQRIANVVFMGMGEPLANIDNVLAAIDLITAPYALGIGARHITVSTAGYVPNMQRLIDYPKQIRLAVSLHGARDEVRSRIMPINDKWPLSFLIHALEKWRKAHNQKITLEYILIEGINDTQQDAISLAKLARQLHAKVNLIPYNIVEELPLQRPSLATCQDFASVLTDTQIPVTLRYEKGSTIDAACGQLRRRHAP